MNTRDLRRLDALLDEILVELTRTKQYNGVRDAAAVLRGWVAEQLDQRDTP